MQSLIRDYVLSDLRVKVSRSVKDVSAARGLHRQLCTSTTGSTHDQITARVFELVSKFDKIDASKVTELADLQKDLSLDSLDTVELVMTLEQESDIEIPDEDADKLKCCADVANYIMSPPKQDTI